MPKNKRNYAILGVLAFAVILVGALFVFSDSAEQSGTIAGEETAGYFAADYDVERDISPETIATPDPITIPEPADTPQDPITQQPRQSDNTRPEQSDDPNEIVLTVIEDRPEPPEPPVNTDPLDEPAAPPTQTPATPPAQTPSAGDTRNGEIYFPGFGWIPDEGGGSEGQRSYGYGCIDTIIGY